MSRNDKRVAAERVVRTKSFSDGKYIHIGDLRLLLLDAARDYKRSGQLEAVQTIFDVDDALNLLENR